MKIIPRPEYQQEIAKYFGKETIIVLTGQRRVGKSYVLLELRQQLMSDSRNNVIYLDKEKKQWDDISTNKELNSFIDSHLISGRQNYILIDEVQEINDFEKSVRNYRTEQNVEIILTGSNAETLSGDLSNILGARYHEIYVQPLTYSDFLRFHDLSDSESSLMSYINAGGLPGLVLYDINDVDVIQKYCEDVLNTTLIKDIILKHRIRNVPFLYNLVRFLADNTGKQISATSVSRYMKGQHTPVSTDLALKYIKFLCDAYIIHKVERFELNGKRLLESNEKYYFEDFGIRNTQVRVGRDKDIEKVIETIVYRELVHAGFNVTVGQLQVGEIDFVCERRDARAYVQVAYLIVDGPTRDREFGNLKKIKDNYSKFVISMTPLVKRTDDDGIIHLGLREFLISGLK